MKSRPRRDQEFREKRVLIVGLGLHGGAASAARWFARQGAQVRVTDLKSAQDLAPSIRRLQGWPIDYHLGQHRPADFRWAEVIYQNQGVLSTMPLLAAARRRGVEIVNEASIFFRFCPATIVGVTGTRGKSTTTALLTMMLQRQHRRTVVSGNIRQVPMLDLLDRLSADHWVVLELSSFQLEFLPAVGLNPHVAIMTNLQVDHLNRYRTLSAYAQAKYQLFRFQRPADVAVLNYNSSWARRVRDITAGQVLWFSQLHRPPGWSVSLRGLEVIERRGRNEERLLSLNDWSLPGRHQRDNLLAAVAGARAMAVSAANIRRAVRQFRGLPHRQELVRRWGGHQFINDTAATTPDGTLAAIEVFPAGLFIVGGVDKALRFRPLAEACQRRSLRLVFLPGSATAKLWRVLLRIGYHGRHAFADSMAEAVQQAVRLARPGQPIVLSPGAASFGLFQHEFDRGQQFVRIVNRLPNALRA